MTRTWQVIDRIAEDKVIAIVRSEDSSTAERACRTLLAAGVGVLEVSLTTPDALDIVRALVSENGADVVVGVGTVLTPQDARLAALAGARLIVTPVFDEQTIRAARRYGMATVIGCGTATEMLAATTVGADAVKLFPASVWKPSDLRGLLQALPQLAVVPTGGVTVQNARDWIDAGAIAVGIGSALTKDGPEQAHTTLAALNASLDLTTRTPARTSGDN